MNWTINLDINYWIELELITKMAIIWLCSILSVKCELDLVKLSWRLNRKWTIDSWYWPTSAPRRRAGRGTCATSPVSNATGSWAASVTSCGRRGPTASTASTPSSQSTATLAANPSESIKVPTYLHCNHLILEGNRTCSDLPEQILESWNMAHGLNLLLRFEFLPPPPPPP